VVGARVVGARVLGCARVWVVLGFGLVFEIVSV